MAGEGGGVRHPLGAVLVVDGVMLRAAIVPTSHRAGLPAEPAGKFGPRLVFEQKAKQRRAFLYCHALEMQRVGAIDIEQFPPRFGVGAYDRMRRR